MLKSFFESGRIEAGCDEAGRGCLAGPVYAAAVILPPDYHHNLLNDSKQLTEKQRDKLRPEIEAEAIAWSVASLDNHEIDKINILNASFAAMHKAIAQLCIKPNLLLIDGNRFRPFQDISHKCIIKGDSLYFSIAAASVLAKTYRDEFMLRAHEEFPQYGWDKNKAYPTMFHRRAITEYGITSYHRLSYKLTDTQLKLF